MGDSKNERIKQNIVGYRAPSILDIGASYFTENPVLEELINRTLSTLELMVLGMAIALPLGVEAGMIAARVRNTFRDRSVRGGSFAAVRSRSSSSPLPMVQGFVVVVGVFSVVVLVLVDLLLQRIDPRVRLKY